MRTPTDWEKISSKINKWNEKIENNDISENEIETLLSDLARINTFLAMNFINVRNLSTIKRNLEKITPQLAKHFNCKEDQIMIDFDSQSIYKIFGNINKDVKIILGNADFRGLNSPKYVFENLEKIYGYAIFEGAFAHFPKLKAIYGDADFLNIQQDFDNLETIGGNTIFDNCSARFPKLKIIYGDADFLKIQQDFDSLETIGSNAVFDNCSAKFKNLKYVWGAAYLYDSNFTDFGQIRFIQDISDNKNEKLYDKFLKEFEYDKNKGKFYRKPEYLKENETKTTKNAETEQQL